MFWKRRGGLESTVERLKQLIDSPELTPQKLRSCCEEVMRQGGRADSEAQNRAIQAIQDYIPSEYPALAGMIATTCGGLVESGADPEIAVSAVIARARRALQQAYPYVEACLQVARNRAGHAVTGSGSGERQENVEVVEEENLEEVIENYGEEVAASMPQQADSFFMLDMLCMPAIAMLTRSKSARHNIQDRDSLVRLIYDFPMPQSSMGWLLDVLLVLDDEELLVLHPEQGRGYRVHIAGIADNFLLHTQLAQTLIGDAKAGWLAGKRPGPGQGVFNLSNWTGLASPEGTGHWIWNEGRPVDILPFEGRRVVLLGPPPYHRSWTPEPRFAAMRPETEVLEKLPPEAVQEWLGIFTHAAALRDQTPGSADL